MSKENESVILNVSETTKGIMEEIQESITSALFDSLETIKRNVKECSEVCDDTQREVRKISLLEEKIAELDSQIKSIDEKLENLQTTQNTLLEKLDALTELMNTPFWKRGKKKGE